jgi:uncharacterized protein YndB with AHSA1/START domain
MRAVRAESEMAVPPERVIRAFLHPADLKGWWRVDQSLVEPHAGGLYALGWGVSPQGYQYVSTGVIAQLEPGHVLHIEQFTYFNPQYGIFGPMSLVVTAEDLGGGRSRATVVQGGYQDGANWDWFYRAVVDGWPLALDYLRQYLELDASGDARDV